MYVVNLWNLFRYSALCALKQTNWGTSHTCSTHTHTHSDSIERVNGLSRILATKSKIEQPSNKLIK